ncbi:alpha/beta hydrolase [Pseudoalteromonas sp. MMG010]|uniref:alpha/beta fold hydrolase n=1 Tax=Pseudoalteromonas sp. MMG010 TaxID=2822685 RepID=UPI001B3A4178|nr:alpha/beta hydrolase [Pseudoalteromonas sp. MMG010]
MIYLIVFIIVFVLFLYSYAPEIDSKQLIQKWQTSDSKFIDINGLKVHYHDQGNDDSDVLIMLHGLSASSYTWENLNQYLANDYRIISLDLPGFGLTGPWPNSQDYRTLHYQQFVELFIKKLGLKRYSLVGNSFGGEIAWRIAKHNPLHVNKLILINATCRPAPYSKRLLAWQIAAIPIPTVILRNILPKFIIKLSLQKGLAQKNKVTSAMINNYDHMTRRKGNREALVLLLKQYQFHASTFSKEKLITPTYILWGDKDNIIPFEFCNEFAIHSECHHIKKMKGLGHIPQEENPQTMAKYLKSFLKHEIIND